MSKPKFSADVYRALRTAGMSNRQIARELDVNEASVRRALRPKVPKGAGPILTGILEEQDRDYEIGRAVRVLAQLLR